MVHKLFFIGNDYYSKSSTRMSCIYEEGTHTRWDWGFVSVALGNGDEVSIRQATPEEANWAAQELRRGLR